MNRTEERKESSRWLVDVFGHSNEDVEQVSKTNTHFWWEDIPDRLYIICEFGLLGVGSNAFKRGYVVAEGTNPSAWMIAQRFLIPSFF